MTNKQTAETTIAQILRESYATLAECHKCMDQLLGTGDKGIKEDQDVPGSLDRLALLADDIECETRALAVRLQTLVDKIG